MAGVGEKQRISAAKLFLASFLLATLTLQISVGRVIERAVETQRNRRDIAIENHVYPEGHDLELDCSASSALNPIIHWRYNNQRIVQGPLDIESDAALTPDQFKNSELLGLGWYANNSTLLIRNARIDDSGIYTCVAEAGPISTEKLYNVTIAPSSSNLNSKLSHTRHLRSSSSDLRTPSRIYLWTDAVIEDIGALIHLNCRATQGINAPTPTITWHINNVEVNQNTAGVTITEQGELEFISSDHFHEALINCTATSEDGSTSDTKQAYIYIFG